MSFEGDHGGYGFEYSTDESTDGWQIKDVARKRIGISTRQLRRLRDGGTVLRNGHSAYLTERVRAGDRLVFQWAHSRSPSVAAEDLPLTIVYEDEDVLVIDKVAGQVVHPTGSYRAGTVAGAVMHHFQKQGTIAHFHPVHRLDKDTSGLLLVAKHPLSHRILDLSLQRRLIRRIYTAVVHGHPYPEAGTIDQPISRVDEHPVKRTVDSGGAHARTHYEVMQHFCNASLVRVTLDTGRTHQIRVHFQYIGTPLLGDALYGGSTDLVERQALHAGQLLFPHPRTREELSFETSIPPDMSRLIDRLRAEDTLR